MHCVKGGCYSTRPTLVFAESAANSVVFPIHPNANQKFTLITILSLWGEKEADRSSQTLLWLSSTCIWRLTQQQGQDPNLPIEAGR